MQSIGVMVAPRPPIYVVGSVGTDEKVSGNTSRPNSRLLPLCTSTCAVVDTRAGETPFPCGNMIVDAIDLD